MKQCELCGKGSQMQGKRLLLRGHYNPTNWSRKQPNLQWAKVSGERKRVCTQCMKKLGKAPVAVKTAAPKAAAKQTA